MVMNMGPGVLTAFLDSCPVACTIKVYDHKFTIVNYASVCGIAYDHNLQS